jgi:hypothetical protein
VRHLKINCAEGGRNDPIVLAPRTTPCTAHQGHSHIQGGGQKYQTLRAPNHGSEFRDQGFGRCTHSPVTTHYPKYSSSRSQPHPGGGACGQIVDSTELGFRVQGVGFREMSLQPCHHALLIYPYRLFFYISPVHINDN